MMSVTPAPVVMSRTGDVPVTTAVMGRQSMMPTAVIERMSVATASVPADARMMAGRTVMSAAVMFATCMVASVVVTTAAVVAAATVSARCVSDRGW